MWAILSSLYWNSYKIASILCFDFLVTRHVGSYFPIGDQTHTSYTGRQSLKHWATRGSPSTCCFHLLFPTYSLQIYYEYFKIPKVYRTLIAITVLPNLNEKGLDQRWQDYSTFPKFHSYTFSPLSWVSLLSFPHRSSAGKILFLLQDSDINTSRKSFLTLPFPQPIMVPWFPLNFQSSWMYPYQKIAMITFLS